MYKVILNVMGPQLQFHTSSTLLLLYTTHVYGGVTWLSYWSTLATWQWRTNQYQ